MGLKDEELQRAKEVAIKFESELKEITLKHTSVKGWLRRRRRHFFFAFTDRHSHVERCQSNQFKNKNKVLGDESTDNEAKNLLVFLRSRFWRRGMRCRSSSRRRRSCMPRLRR